MQRKAIIITIYAVFIFIGGIIGYVVANSLVSILVSSAIALLLLGCSFFVRKDSAAAADVAAGISFCLLLFFGYRFLMSYQFAPAGIMTLVSAAIFVYLIARRKNEQIKHTPNSSKLT